MVGRLYFRIIWKMHVDVDCERVCVCVCLGMFLVENFRSEKGHTAMESIAETWCDSQLKSAIKPSSEKLNREPLSNTCFALNF